MKSPFSPKPEANGPDTRFCRHFLSGKTHVPKMCIGNQECFHCAFDQWLDHLSEAQLGTRSQKIDGYRLAAAA